jgi:hypothetical protein
MHRVLSSKLLTLALSSSALLALGDAEAQCSPASAETATFHTDTNFQGTCVQRGPGDYPTSAHIGMPEDSISSLKVGINAQVYVCSDSYFEGQCETVLASDSSLGNNAIGHDRISSAKIQIRGTSASCSPGTGEVALFGDAYYNGPCVVRGTGEYSTQSTMGLRSDTVSSVRVGAGVNAVLCRDTYYGGDCESFATDEPDLRSRRIGGDQTSSLRVVTRDVQECLPGENEVAVFAHQDFVGPCHVNGLGDYETAGAFGIANDVASSIRVGRNVQAVLCTDAAFAGSCRRFDRDIANLANSEIGHDSTSSIRVQMRGTTDCAPGPGQVAFFEHSDFLAPCTTRPAGDYPTSTAIGIRDNTLSSIRIGAGVQACVCSASEFREACETFTTDDPNLGDDRIRHDTVSSARVQTVGAACLAVPPQPTGFKEIAVINCNSARRPITLWLRNQSTGAAFALKGTLNHQYDRDGSCGFTNAAPMRIALPGNDLYEFVAVDSGLSGCTSGQPTQTFCQRLRSSSIRANASGTTLSISVN